MKETFLHKVIGTIVKDDKGKKHLVCSACQRQLKAKKEMLGRI